MAAVERVAPLSERLAARARVSARQAKLRAGAVAGLAGDADPDRNELLVLPVHGVLSGSSAASNGRARSVPADDPGLASDGLDAVLVLNTYHELDDAPAVLAHVRRALRPGGRLVVVDRRPRSAAAHVPGEHELTPLEGEAGIRASGFEIVQRDDAFIDRPGDPDLWWMIVARRPKAAPR